MTGIKPCRLFEDLEGAEIERAMNFFRAERVRYAKGSILHRSGERMTFFGLVNRGAVEVSMDDYEGQHIIMAVVGPGGTFGESLCFLGRETEVSVTVTEETEILKLYTDNLYKPGQEEWETELCNRFTSMLAARTLEMNRRIQILSMPTLRKKILLYLSTIAGKKNQEITIPMDRAGLAAYLAADRSALSRELSAMKKDGLIQYHKNIFKLL